MEFIKAHNMKRKTGQTLGTRLMQFAFFNAIANFNSHVYRRAFLMMIWHNFSILSLSLIRFNCCKTIHDDVQYVYKRIHSLSVWIFIFISFHSNYYVSIESSIQTIKPRQWEKKQRRKNELTIVCASLCKLQLFYYCYITWWLRHKQCLPRLLTFLCLSMRGRRFNRP